MEITQHVEPGFTVNTIGIGPSTTVNTIHDVVGEIAFSSLRNVSDQRGS
jgi:hypothetical protein